MKDEVKGIEKDINDALGTVAKQYGKSIWELKRMIYTEIDNMYEREDIEYYLEEHLNYQFTEEDVSIIQQGYHDDCDSELGTWDNIQNVIDSIKCNNRDLLSSTFGPRR